MVSWGAGLPIVLDDEPSRSSGVPAGCCAKAGAATSVDSAMIRMDFFIREVLGGCLVDACNVAVLLGQRTRSGSSGVPLSAYPTNGKVARPAGTRGCAALAPDGMDLRFTIDAGLLAFKVR